jgi:hypothetical protein
VIAKDPNWFNTENFRAISQKYESLPSEIWTEYLEPVLSKCLETDEETSVIHKIKRSTSGSTALNQCITDVSDKPSLGNSGTTVNEERIELDKDEEKSLIHKIKRSTLGSTAPNQCISEASDRPFLGKSTTKT